jgi:hypothetical protein
MSDLTGFLRAEHRMIGLSLVDEEQEPYEMFLVMKGIVIRPFGRYATLAEIHYEADQIVEQGKARITFGKEVSNG